MVQSEENGGRKFSSAISFRDVNKVKDCPVLGRVALWFVHRPVVLETALRFSLRIRHYLGWNMLHYRHWEE